jgi:hypothetical protein
MQVALVRDRNGPGNGAVLVARMDQYSLSVTGVLAEIGPGLAANADASCDRRGPEPGISLASRIIRAAACGLGSR